MKKPTKKLALQTETIRTLENDYLARAQGGSVVSSGTSVISVSSGTSVISISSGTSVITPSTSQNPSGGRH